MSFVLHRPATQKYDNHSGQHLLWKRPAEFQGDVLWNFLSLAFFPYSPQIRKYAHVATVLTSVAIYKELRVTTSFTSAQHMCVHLLHKFSPTLVK
jgi:hypothetical protein